MPVTPSNLEQSRTECQCILWSKTISCGDLSLGPGNRPPTGAWCWAWCAKTSPWHLFFILTLPQRGKTLWHLGCPGAQAQGIYWDVVNLHFCETGPEGFDVCGRAVLRQQILTESCSWSLPLAIRNMEALGNTRATLSVRCRLVNYGLSICWGAGTWMQGSQRTWPPYCMFLCMSLKGFGICNLY